MEDHLVLLHRPLVEHLGGDVLGGDVDAFGPGLVQHVGEQPHLELEAQDVHAGDVLLAAFQDDLFHEQARHRQVDRPHRHQPPGLLAVEGGEALGLFGAVGAQDQVEEGGFLFLQLLLLFGLAQVGVDADVVLALVLAQVEDFEGAVVLAFGLQLPLHADQPLAGGVDGELAQVGDDPLAAQFFGHGGRGAGAAEEVGDEVAFVGGGFDDAFEQGFGFLGGVVESSLRLELIGADIVPDVLTGTPLLSSRYRF